MKRSRVILLVIFILLGVAVLVAKGDILSRVSALKNNPSVVPGRVPTTSDDWLSVVEGWGYYKDKVSSEGCGVRTENVVIAKGSQNESTLSFERIFCPPTDTNALYEYRGQYLATDSKVISFVDPKYLSEEDKSIYQSEDNLKGRTILDYWILSPGQDVEKFIASLTDEAHCIVKKDKDTGHFVIGPDDYLYKKTMENADGIVTFCGTYGVGGSARYFEKVGNALLYVNAGQDAYPPFDPSSFRISK